MTRHRSKLLTITIPAFVVATLVVAAGVEVWVRIRWNPKNGQPGLFLSDAVRGQRLAANYDGWFAGVPLHINNLGFRDPRDYSLARRPNTFRCVSGFMYISVLRHTSRSTREMGASLTKSLRPKITARRRSLRNTYR